MLKLNVSQFIDVSGSTMKGNCVYSWCSKSDYELPGVMTDEMILLRFAGL
jgi:hypothetical protein